VFGSIPNYRQRAVILILAAGIMLLLGLTLFKRVLIGKWYLLYWLGCLALTTGSMVSALLEFRAIRRQLREAQLDLLRNHFSTLPGHNEVPARFNLPAAPESRCPRQDKDAPASNG
jgi:hypothetical protein